jgi:hypothetical protein
MKVYTVSGDCRLQEGIQTTKDEKFGQIVFLGESGRGRTYQKVGLFKKNPAVVNDKGLILNTHPVKITPDKEKPEKFFVVLAKPEGNQNDDRVLVRINTDVVYTRGCVGRWETISGQPQDLVKGQGAHGDAGRTAQWYDGLVVMKPGDVIKVIPDGGYKTGVYALFFEDKKLTLLPCEEYEAMTAQVEGKAEMI